MHEWLTRPGGSALRETGDWDFHRYHRCVNVTSRNLISVPDDLAYAVAGLRDRKHVRQMADAWRRLTDGGAPTLVACSGGADSLALALALRAIDAPIALGHVRHDLRPLDVTEAEASHVARVGEALSVATFVRAVSLPERGNAESAARRLRYDALTEMCQANNLRYIASAHHGQDQLETMLMGVLRGAGPRGLAGVAELRSLAPGVELIRPALGVGRAAMEAICRAVDLAWAEDETNADESRFRAGLRHGPVADLLAMRPNGAAGATRSARLLSDAAALIDERANEIFGDNLSWDRESLRGQRRVVLGAGLRAAALRLTGGVGADQFGADAVDRVVNAIMDDVRSPRVFEWARGVRFEIRARTVGIALHDATREGDEA